MKHLGQIAAMVWLGTWALPGQEVETQPQASAVSTLPSAVPERLPLERYQMLWERSPFEIAVVAESAAPTGIRAEWLLASLSRANGKPLAVLVNKNTGESVVVRQDEQNAHGLTLVDAVIAEDFQNSRITVRRGTETAQMQFQEQDLATLATPSPAIPTYHRPANVPGTPGASSMASPMPSGMQVSAPSNPNAPPSPRRIIRRVVPAPPESSSP